MGLQDATEGRCGAVEKTVLEAGMIRAGIIRDTKGREIASIQSKLGVFYADAINK